MWLWIAGNEPRFRETKGGHGLEFDSLRQACIDPGGRAHVGVEPPASATRSQVISEVQVLDAPWMKTPVIPLNPGLVAHHRGPRFRKDTALAELPPEELEWINTLVETTLSKKEVTICTARPLLVLKG